METHYYIMEESCATEDTGNHYPQISKMSSGYDFNAPNSVHSLGKYRDSLPMIEPNFDYFVMNGKSKLTDVLSNSIVSGKGFIINSKVKEILEKYTLPLHKFFLIKVKYRQRFLNDYYWFHVVCDLSDSIDFPKSSFYISDIANREIDTVFLKNKIDFFKKKQEMKHDWMEKNAPYRSISVNKIYLKTETGYDIFYIGGMIDGVFYVTENLRSEFVEKNVTGIDLTKTDKILITN